MKQVTLGQTEETVGAIAYGCWRFAESTVKEAEAKINSALDTSMTLIDTADIYGLGETRGFGGAEVVLGDVLKASPSLRDRMFLATKGGIDAVRPYDGSFDYLTEAMEKSLKRLQTGHVDLYQIHRPDLSISFKETARALNKMLHQGKTRYVGVSNFTAAQTRALQAHLDAPLLTTQPEFSALCQDPITDGTLDLCMEKSMTALAWSPLAGGALATGQHTSDKGKKRFKRVLKVIKRLAETYNTNTGAIALAFTMAHGADVIPIIGTQTLKRITDSAKATDIPMSGRDFYDIIEAYNGAQMP